MMTPRRRQVIQLLAIGGVGSLSGCINVGREGQPTNESQTTEPSGNQTEDTTAENETDTDDEDEQEEEELTTNEQFATQIRDVREYLDWRSSPIGYSDAYSNYRDGLESAIDLCRELEDADFSSVGSEDLDELEAELENIKNVAFNDFNEYYRYHYSWTDFIPESLADLRDNLRRAEENLFIDRLRETRQVLVERHQHITDRYPVDMIDTIEPYERFLNKTGKRDQLFKSFIFEGLHIGKNPDGFYVVGKDDISIAQLPFGAGTQEDFDTIRTPEDRNITVREDAEWFARPNTAEDRYLLTLYNYALIDNEFPGADYYDISEQGGLSKVTPADLSRGDPIGLSIQTFESESAASEALESIKSQGTADGTATYHGVEYEQIFYVGEDHTYYVSLIQVDDMIIGLDPKRTPWDVREYVYTDQPNANTEAEKTSTYSLEYITAGMFIDATIEN